jgi:hypothetical protein
MPIELNMRRRVGRSNGLILEIVWKADRMSGEEPVRRVPLRDFSFRRG